MNLRTQLIKSFENGEHGQPEDVTTIVDDVIPSDEVKITEIDADITLLETDETLLTQVSDDIDTTSGILEQVGKAGTRGVSQEGIMFAEIALANIFKRYQLNTPAQGAFESYSASSYDRVVVTTSSMEGVGENILKLFKYLASVISKVIQRVVASFTSLTGARRKLAKQVEALKKIEDWNTEGTINTTRYTNVFVDDQGNVLTSSSDIEKEIKQGATTLMALHEWSTVTDDVIKAINNPIPFVNYMNTKFKTSVMKFFPNNLTDKALAKDTSVDQDLSGESGNLLGGVRIYIANTLNEGSASASLKYGIIRPEIKKQHEEHAFEKLTNPKDIVELLGKVVDHSTNYDFNISMFKKNMATSIEIMNQLSQIAKSQVKTASLPKEYRDWVKVNFDEEGEASSRLRDYKDFLVWVKDIVVHPWFDVARHELIMLNKVVEYVKQHTLEKTTIDA